MSSATHTAIAATAKGQIGAIQVTTRAPGKGEVRIKVSYASLIAFDTYVTDFAYAIDSYPVILGFNASGLVVEVSEGVHDLKSGDRVTSFSYQGQNKGMQEYTIQPRTTVAAIPHELPLDEAATIPDNFVCAYHTLFNQLGLPRPDSFPAISPPPSASELILIYGAGATVGQYLIQLLHAADYNNVIATASEKHHAYLQSLGARRVIDYKSPSAVQDVAGFGKYTLVVDCITSEGSLRFIGKVVSPQGKVALMLPIKEGEKVREGAAMHWSLPEGKNPLPEGTQTVGVRTFQYQNDEWQKENLMPKVLPELLTLKLIRPNRVKLMAEKDFESRVSAGLDLLRHNKVSGEKVVVKIAEGD